MTRDCRGADNADEFTRQRDKIVTALAAMDADVVGLIEIENNDDVAVADLVAGLNDDVGAGTYDYVATGADRHRRHQGRRSSTSRPRVTPIGAFAVLDSSVDPSFDDDKNRPVLAQTFTENATGAAFTVVVNHFKSKGSAVRRRR